MIWYEDYDFDLIKPHTIYYKGTAYDDNIYTLDTETTNLYIKDGKPIAFDKSKNAAYYEDTEKVGYIYIWMLGINDMVIYGRTIWQLQEFLQMLHLYCRGILIFYIHNLPFEFQFLRNIITDFEVFARKSRHPIKAFTSDYNIEFRDSLILTGYSLAKCPEVYHLQVEKAVGDLDYLKIRTPETVLTETELHYCEMDIVVLYQVIEAEKKTYKHVAYIPLTSTGKVRREVKKLFVKDRKYHQQIKTMQPKNAGEFKLLTMAFVGGYTHSNGINTNRIIEDVYSYDITSSYPTVMVTEKFPMTSFFRRKEKTLTKEENYCFIYDITFYEIYADCSMIYLSKSKAREVDKSVAENGRLKGAAMARYILTDVDLDIVLQTYHIGSMVINEKWEAWNGYLPKKYVGYVLKLYHDKTVLKGMDPEQYMHAKAFLNALYGMAVTNTIRDEVIFDGEWDVMKLSVDDIEQKLQDQKTKPGRAFLSFAWGVWITAYARRNLWDMIIKTGEDCIYCDTDSVKFTGEGNKIYFEQYNKDIVQKMKKACRENEVDFSLSHPADTKGEVHQLGVYDYEGKIDKFKTLGAKKYAMEKGGQLQITVSGVNKKSGAKAIGKIENFKDGKIFNYDESGRLIATYNDDQPDVIIDGWKMDCRYGINLMPTTYKLSLEPTYADLIIADVQMQHEKLEVLKDVKI